MGLAQARPNNYITSKRYSVGARLSDRTRYWFGKDAPDTLYALLFRHNKWSASNSLATNRPKKHLVFVIHVFWHRRYGPLPNQFVPFGSPWTIANSFLKSILVFGETDFITPSAHLPSSCYYCRYLTGGDIQLYYCVLLQICGKHQRVVQKNTCAHLKLTGKYAFS